MNEAAVVAPVAPVVPAAPVTPIVGAAPVTPVVPVAPVTPAAPVADLGSMLVAPANVAPDKYTLTLPENPTLEASSLGEIAAFAKAQGLSNEKAQELVVFQNKVLADMELKSQQETEKQSKEWIEQIKADPKLGGDNLVKNQELSRRFVQRFGNEGFVKLLSDSGLGNHPAVFAFVSSAAAAMGEDNLVHGRTPGMTTAPAGSDAALQAAMFNTTK